MDDQAMMKRKLGGMEKGRSLESTGLSSADSRKE
jgi:hypothetical protein